MHIRYVYLLSGLLAYLVAAPIAVQFLPQADFVLVDLALVLVLVAGARSLMGFKWMFRFGVTLAVSWVTLEVVYLLFASRVVDRFRLTRGPGICRPGGIHCLERCPVRRGSGSESTNGGDVRVSVDRARRGLCFHTHSCRLPNIVRGYRRSNDRSPREGDPIFVLQLRHAYHPGIRGDHASITSCADARLYGSSVRAVLSHDSRGGAGRHAPLEAAVQ